LGGICDVIVRVSADDQEIELLACHARGASTLLEMKCEGDRGNKGFVTATAGTAQVGLFVDPGVTVLTEVVLGPETTIAVLAVTGVAVGWLVEPGVKVPTKVVLCPEMTIAVPAVMVDGTLSVVS
jgi:hypothetical protein